MKTFNKLMGDIQTVKGLVDKYKPVVQDKIKEYKPIIKKDAEKVIREYVKLHGRVMLRQKLNAIAKDFPGNENVILNAGLQFLSLEK